MNRSSDSAQTQNSRPTYCASRFSCSGQLDGFNPYRSPKSVVLAPSDTRSSSSTSSSSSIDSPSEFLPLPVHTTDRILLKPRHRCHFMSPPIFSGNRFEGDSGNDFYGHEYEWTMIHVGSSARVDTYESDWAPKEWRRTIVIPLNDIPEQLLVPEL